MADDQALMELQTQLSFQEDTIAQLNDVVARQQRELSQLQQDFNYLKEQVQSMLRMQLESGDVPPPHY